MKGFSKGLIAKQDEIEKLWAYVDGLGEEDYQRLITFIKTNNSPVILDNEAIGTGLLNSAYVHSKVLHETELEEIVVGQDKSNKGGVAIPYMSYSFSVYQYVLSRSFFRLLKYSTKKYGKISHSR